MSRDAFYRALEGTHNLYFDELRFGQFMDLFLGYVKNETKYDLYYITDTELMDILKDFLRKMHK